MLGTVVTLVSTLTTAYAEDMRPGYIKGIVQMESGEPVEHARVTLRDEEGMPVGTVGSGADGRFVFEELRPGRYYLYTKHPAFRADRVEVRVHSGDVTYFTIVLTR
jgi:hypothetical protein